MIKARIFTLILAVLAGWAQMGALTPAQVLDKAASGLLKSNGIKATYTVVADGHRNSGVLLARGAKFYIESGGVNTWYDGKTQWNYSPSAKEVTLSTPTAAEIATISPYALVRSYKSNFSLAPLKSNVPGTYAVRLNAKSKNNSIKTAVIYIRSKDFQPVRLDMTMKSGQSASIMITNITTGVKISDSSFVFPSGKYPGVKVIDLR